MAGHGEPQAPQPAGVMLSDSAAVTEADRRQAHLWRHGYGWTRRDRLKRTRSKYPVTFVDLVDDQGAVGGPADDECK